MTLLRRPGGTQRPRVAARIILEAPDLAGARAAAEAALEARSGGEGRWSLGVLRPLTPRAPGTHRYRAVFSTWQDTDDRFVRRDMHTLEIWAADAQSARRMAQQEIRQVADYEPSWRIRKVVRTEDPAESATP